MLKKYELLEQGFLNSTMFPTLDLSTQEGLYR